MNDNLTYVSNHNTYSCVYNTRYLIEWLQSLNIECVWDVIFHILVIINDIFQPSMFYYMYHYLNYMYVWLINVSLYLSYRHVSVNYKRWIYIYINNIIFLILLYIILLMVLSIIAIVVFQWSTFNCTWIMVLIWKITLYL